MSNKTRLQTNNTNLQALIDKANALPEAGGGSSGGSVETYSGSITATLVMSPDLSQITVFYMDETLTTKSISSPASPFNFSVIKNSVIFVKGGMLTAKSGCTILGGSSGQYAYQITADNFELTC
jgi:hypothetical protein